MSSNNAKSTGAPEDDGGEGSRRKQPKKAARKVKGEGGAPGFSLVPVGQPAVVVLRTKVPVPITPDAIRQPHPLPPEWATMDEAEREWAAVLTHVTTKVLANELARRGRSMLLVLSGLPAEAKEAAESEQVARFGTTYNFFCGPHFELVGLAQKTAEIVLAGGTNGGSEDGSSDEGDE